MLCVEEAKENFELISPSEKQTNINEKRTQDLESSHCTLANKQTRKINAYQRDVQHMIKKESETFEKKKQIESFDETAIEHNQSNERNSWRIKLVNKLSKGAKKKKENYVKTKRRCCHFMYHDERCRCSEQSFLLPGCRA